MNRPDIPEIGTIIPAKCMDCKIATDLSDCIRWIEHLEATTNREQPLETECGLLREIVEILKRQVRIMESPSMNQPRTTLSPTPDGVTLRRGTKVCAAYMKMLELAHQVGSAELWRILKQDGVEIPRNSMGNMMKSLERQGFIRRIRDGVFVAIAAEGELEKQKGEKQ